MISFSLFVSVFAFAFCVCVFLAMECDMLLLRNFLVLCDFMIDKDRFKRKIRGNEVVLLVDSDLRSVIAVVRCLLCFCR